MSKVAQYLQEHLIGEVMTSPDARDYFSTDGSIFKVVPQIIVYPRAENDVRKAARFTWQLAERGRVISLTARGSGTDLGGAAIGGGIILVFPAHMNKILTLDSNKGLVTIEPGLNFGRLQQTLQTHGLCLPPAPASFEYSTIGGAIANNAAGEKSVKYGVMKDYVRELRVVLANGEVITTSRISKRDVGKKMGLSTFEGEIYRNLDAILNEYKDLLAKTEPIVQRSNVGYDLWSIREKNGSMDLTQLIVGSQGTLGIVTEAKLETESYNPKTSLLISSFDDIAKANTAILELRKLQPSIVEMVDENLLNFVDTHNPSLFGGVIEKPYAKVMLFVQFDDQVNRIHKRRAKKARKLLEKLAANVRITNDIHEQEDWYKVRQSAATLLWHDQANKRALPIIEDAIVPPEKFAEFLNKIYELFKSYGLEAAVWGHAGSANLHVLPMLDLSQVGDRQKVFKLMDDYYKMVLELGGSISAQDNDGRLRGPYVEQQYGKELYEVFKKVKQLFDPFNTLNPGVKIDVSQHDLQSLMRQEYSLAHFYDHMPRT